MPKEKTDLVLVVDDDPVIRQVLQAFLEKEGYDVIESETGEQALALFKIKKPDLILLDVCLGGLSGPEVCRKIRSTSYGRDIPVLMITALEDMASVQRAYYGGATDFIAKPINFAVLAYRIPYIIESSRTMFELRKKEFQLANAQRILRIGHWEWDLERDEKFWSRELASLLGLKEAEVIADIEQFLSFVHPDDRENLRLELSQEKNEISPYHLQYRVFDATGRLFHVQERAEILYDEDNAPRYLLSTIQDISDQKKTEEKISFLAYYDQVSGLPNRAFFRKILDMTLLESNRQAKSFCVFFLDLDDFKQVNDTLGHGAGDVLLKEVADRIVACLRSNDYICRPNPNEIGNGSVARLGGDEFTIILKDITNPDNVQHIAKRLIKSINKPLMIEGNFVSVSVSIGVVIYPADGKTAEVLLKNADMAMYHAKELGKNTCQFYSSVMNDRAEKKMSLESELKKAFQEKQLKIFYQPRLCLQTKKIVAAEALVRWYHPDQGWISPRDFLPLAEETQLINLIDQWVVKTVCEQTHQWNTSGYPDLKVAVNLSLRQFNDKGLVRFIQKAITDSGVMPNAIEIELSEKAVMHKRGVMMKRLLALKKVGIGILLDNFGSGYSSLRSLSEFPLDGIKIDPSFITEMVDNVNDATIVKTVIHLTHGLHLRFIAQGVESNEQIRLLEENGCDQIQGFLISPPVNVEEFTALLKNQWRDAA